MLVLLGQGTRLQRYLVGLPKAYRAGLRLGVTSATGDPTGELSPTGRRADEASLREAIGQLTGEIRQQVPAYSAVKVGGVRLYRRARAGEDIADLPVRTVHIDRLDLTSFDEASQEGELVVECSSGTYVRSLVADLGELSGAGAYCTTLERTQVGPFALADADPDRVMSLSDGLGFLPERQLSREEAAAVGHGRPVEGAAAGPVRLTFEGGLVAVGVEHDGLLHPETVVA
jgi:tRNA pseudouridine55 synthase